jgi:hypothetical protein
MDVVKEADSNANTVSRKCTAFLGKQSGDYSPGHGADDCGNIGYRVSLCTAKNARRYPPNDEAERERANQIQGRDDILWHRNIPC